MSLLLEKLQRDVDHLDRSVGRLHRDLDDLNGHVQRGLTDLRGDLTSLWLRQCLGNWGRKPNHLHWEWGLGTRCLSWNLNDLKCAINLLLDDLDHSNWGWSLCGSLACPWRHLHRHWDNVGDLLGSLARVGCQRNQLDLSLSGLLHNLRRHLNNSA